MSKITKFRDFQIDSIRLNESSVFDTLKNVFTKISMLFEKPADLAKQVDQAMAKAGTTIDNVSSKSVKIGTTVVVKLVSPADENVKSILSLTKLADLPDSSGLFQITGSDNEDFLKSLGVTSLSNLTIVGILAIVDPIGFKKKSSLSMRIFKNISKDGKAIVTEAAVNGAINVDLVAKETPQI